MFAWIRKLLTPIGGVIENKNTIGHCMGCQQAMHRINNGILETKCNICGAYWLSKSAVDIRNNLNNPNKWLE